jgi:hypothetical protein
VRQLQGGYRPLRPKHLLLPASMVVRGSTAAPSSGKTRKPPTDS